MTKQKDEKKKRSSGFEMDPLKKSEMILNKVLFSSFSRGIGPEPFDFEISIVKLEGMTITRIDINGTELKDEDVENDPDDDKKLLGKAKAIVTTDTFLLDIDVVGRPFTSTPFNLKCDGKQVFPSDEKIEIDSRGFGGFFNTDVPLP
jgi:hypothetical protein